MVPKTNGYFNQLCYIYSIALTFGNLIQKLCDNDRVSFIQSLSASSLLLAHLESAFLLIWKTHNIWGQGGGEPFIGGDLGFGMGNEEITRF